MKPQAEVLVYMEMVRADIREYRDLRELLEQQFQAALRHQVEPLRDLGERISALVDVLQKRRDDRQALAAKVTGAASLAAHEELLRQLSGRPAALLQGWSDELRALVVDCKQMNQRNCGLITEQHDIMRRVLNQEEPTYAPA